jgi:hypothetical protein
MGLALVRGTMARIEPLLRDARTSLEAVDELARHQENKKASCA